MKWLTYQTTHEQIGNIGSDPWVSRYGCDGQLNGSHLPLKIVGCEVGGAEPECSTGIAGFSPGFCDSVA